MSLPYDVNICLGCMGIAIGRLIPAVYEHRPTKTDMEQAIAKELRPVVERLAALELGVAAIQEALGGRQRAGVLPYSKSKTEAAREMLLGGRPNKEVGAALGMTAAEVKKIKYRLTKGR